MTMPFTGGCVCGQVRYECSVPPLLMLNCHCRDCQQVTGGAYAPLIVVPLNSFKIIAGTLQRFATTRLSGRPNQRGFCGRCGSPLTAGEDPERNLIGLTAASLDDPGGFTDFLKREGKLHRVA